MYEGIDFTDELTEQDAELEGILLSSGLGGLVRVRLYLDPKEKHPDRDYIDTHIHPSEIAFMLGQPSIGKQICGMSVDWGWADARAWDMSFVQWDKAEWYKKQPLDD